MRVGLGTVFVLSCLTGAWVSSGSWFNQVETGLTQMLTGNFAVSLPAATESRGLRAGWRDPEGSATEPSIAMSESDWLKLADDMAPVSYLPAPVVPQAPVQNEQQPL